MGSTHAIKLDDDQTKAVALRHNAAVTAGAGSGKTTVLAERYLSLVQGTGSGADGVDVRSILCLTYTRKAAAEMKERIYKRLRASEDKNSRLAVQRFAEASISTIDSFCGDILRSSAQEYGYPPDFAIDDDRARGIAEDEALAFLLEKEDNPVLAELFSSMGFEACWQDLFASAAYRYGLPAQREENDFDSMPAKQAGALAAFMDSLLQVIINSSCSAAEQIRALGKADPGKGKDIPELLDLLGRINAICCTQKSIDENRESLEGLLRRLAGKRVLSRVAESGPGPILKEWQKEVKKAAGTYLEASEAEPQLERNKNILVLLKEFCARYLEAKRREGIMSFMDASVATVDLLKKRKEIRAYWKKRYQFIMIDEFQDDNELQKELLYLLAEKNGSEADGIPSASQLEQQKLFFVGDEKQSIYRFRGADVSVFKRLSGELSSGMDNGGTVASLNTNYRSEPALIDFYNSFFPGVFSPSDGRTALEDFEAGYEAAQSRKATQGVEPRIELFWKQYKKTSELELDGLVDDDRAIADFIARRIKDSVENKSLLIANKGDDRKTRPARAAEYSDFAILFRTLKNQHLIERAFRVHHIPYNAVTTWGLFVESPANDIYNALRLSLLPDDEKAYAAVLRSPFAGISDDGLVSVLAPRTRRRGGSASPALPFPPEDEARLADKDDKARFRHGRQIMEQLARMSDRSSIAETVSYLWFEGGLRLSILERPEAHPYLEHYDYLFALAVDADSAGKNLETFVSELEPRMGIPSKFEEEREIQRESGEGVTMMTIHKSKGLEFPVVIIPWINTGLNQGGDSDAYYYSPSSGLSFTVKDYEDPDAKDQNIFSQKIDSTMNKAMEMAELKRLLYVACTRAESHLFFVARESVRAVQGSFLGLLTQNPEQVGKRNPKTGTYDSLPAAVKASEIPDLTIDEYKRMYSGGKFQDPGTLRPFYEGASPLDRSYGRRFVSVTDIAAALWKTDPRSAAEGQKLKTLECEQYLANELKDDSGVFGTLCHALVEEKLSAARSKRPDRSAEIAIQTLPADLGETARKSLGACAMDLAEGFMDSDLGRQALASPSVSMEKEIILKGGRDTNAVFIKCRLDLLLENGDRIDIIDFKSDAARQKGLHDYQLALYRYAVQRLLPGKELHCFIFWLRDSSTEEVELTLDAGRIESDLSSVVDSLYSGSPQNE